MYFNNFLCMKRLFFLGFVLWCCRRRSSYWFRLLFSTAIITSSLTSGLLCWRVLSLSLRTDISRDRMVCLSLVAPVEKLTWFRIVEILSNTKHIIWQVTHKYTPPPPSCDHFQVYLGQPMVTNGFHRLLVCYYLQVRCSFMLNQQCHIIHVSQRVCLISTNFQ